MLQASGHLDEALIVCRRAVRFNPELIGGNLNLGNVLRQKGDLAASPELTPSRARIEALEQLNGDTRPLVLDRA